MEGVPKRAAHETESIEAERAHKEALRNQIFDQLVATQVLDSFHDDIDDAGIDAEDYQEIVQTFAALPEEDKRAVLAIPAQLRPKVFANYAKHLEDGKMTGEEVVADILAKAHAHGFTLGFHLSPRDIKPEKDGSWQIRGTEPDHRHSDLPMAYYSLDYAHRYLRKPAQFLYVVRAELGENSAHYRDNDRSWGHASSLSVVDRIDMHELENEMERRFKAMEAAEETAENEKRDAA